MVCDRSENSTSVGREMRQITAAQRFGTVARLSNTRQIGWRIVLGLAGCLALSSTSQAQAPQPELLPVPVLPSIAATTTDATYDPLWSGYQAEKQCNCVECQPKKPTLLRKALGGLSRGFDLVMFGKKTASCDGCDSGCDGPATCDDACDAPGQFEHSLPPTYQQPFQHHHQHGHTQTPRPQQPPTRPQLPQAPRVPQLQSPPTPATTPVDPFQDDPITSTKRPKPRVARTTR